MWLLNTSSFKLEEFHSDVPSYAILSHRWKNGEELSFGGLEEPHPYADRTGYKKVKTFCVEARKKRLGYVWVDTCCIDKKSSAELSEAINSMYTFYSRATTCYVYLHDVVALEDFEQSSWFTRGWTLQELLAPSKMHFFNHKWEPIGSKGKLAPRIERITGIPGKALRNFNPNGYCIADKLSWSAQRQTTREEDCAYCLLGVFQINMPLLYGEGARAFQRLQEEIMKTSTDMSIFLWQGPAVSAFGMLASNPSCFADTPDNIRSMTRSYTNLFSMSEGWTLNNAGITIKASICPYLITSDFECIFAMHLHEQYTFSGNLGLAIFVKKEQEQGSRTFARVTIDGVAWTSSATEPDRYMWSRHRVVKLILLRQSIQDIRTPTRPCGFTVTFTLDALDLCAAYQRPPGNFEASLRSWQRIRKTSSGSLKCWFSANPKYATGVHGYLLITLMYDIQVLICLGLSDNFQPLCVVLPLCKRELDEGLGCARILREYRTISKNRSDSFEIFDTEIQMICMCGEDNALENFTDIGLSLGVSDQSSHTGKLEAMIQFDVGKFVQYYVPTADLSSYEAIGYIPREDFGKLSDVELQIGSTRRSRYLF
jgi:hypothetical protein